MTIEQRARQQLAEAESAYEFHSRQALHSDAEDRDEHLAAAGDCMIAVDVLRDVLKGEQQNGSASQDYAGNGHREAIDDPESCYGELIDTYDGDKFYVGVPSGGLRGTVIWCVNDRGASYAFEETITGAIDSGCAPPLWKRFAKALQSAKRLGLWSKQVGNGHDCCNVAPVRVTVSTVKPAPTFSDLYEHLKRALGSLGMEPRATLAHSIAVNLCGSLGIPVPTREPVRHD